MWITVQPIATDIRRNPTHDAIVSAAVAVAAAIVVASYLGVARRSSVPFYTYQEAFGPAVMQACGRGFVNPLPATGSPLAKFLAPERDRFDCSELPVNLEYRDPTPYQHAERYLLLASTTIWKITGISWRALDVLVVVLAAFTMAVAYLVFRLVLPAWLSVILTLFWLVSPLHLRSLTALRDYSKAPFFVLTVLVIGTIVLRRTSSRRLAALAAILGAALGVGFGFRLDVGLNLVPFAAAVALFDAGGLVGRVRAKLVALVLCGTAFWLCARPAMGVYQGGNVWHVALLGLMEPFDQRLGTSPSVYSFGGSYSDDLVDATVAGYAARVESGDAGMDASTPAYGTIRRRYFLALAHEFPADLAIRGWASIIKVLNLPFAITYGDVPAGIRSRVIERVYRIRAWAMTRAEGITPVLLCGMVLALTIDRPRCAIALATLVAFFAAYPMIQFDARHIFPLEILSLWINAVVIWLLIQRWSDLRRRLADSGTVRRMLALGVLAILLVAGSMASMRRYQSDRVRELLASYVHAAAAPVEMTMSATTDGMERLGVALSPSGSQSTPILTEMLAVHLNPAAAQCRDAPQVPLMVRYLQRDNSSRDDFSHVVRMPRSQPSPTVAFIPVHVFADNPHIRFVGIEIPREQRACITGITRLKSAQQMPLLLESVVTEPESSAALYQRLGDNSESLPPHVRAAIKRLQSALLFENQEPST